MDREKIQYWLKQVVSMVSIFAVLVWLFFYLVLPIITRHGEAIAVPNLFEMNIYEATAILKEKNLRAEFMQSSVFNVKSPENSVMQQYPKVGNFVKKDKTIYLTLNTNASKHILMPNLLDHTIRNAYMVLKSSGLNLGKIEYVKDIAHNGVLEQYCEGEKIVPGKYILVGTTIDLLVGIDSKDQDICVPQVSGQDLEEIELFLLANNLRLGSVRQVVSNEYAPGYVVSYSPGAGEMVPIGTKIDLCIANEESFVANEKLITNQIQTESILQSSEDTVKE